MKMRIHGNTLRFRLNRREVESFQKGGRVSASIAFPAGGRLSYALIKGGSEIEARFDGAEVQIHVPESTGTEWARTDQVGITRRISLQGADELEIIIEKDFQCLHKGEAGKDADAYPNPMAETAG